MASVKKTYVLDMMKEKELRYFTIKDSDNKSLISDQKDPDCTLEKAIAKFEEAIENIDGPFVYVKLASKSGKEKEAGGNVTSGTYEFRVKLDSENVKGIEGINNNAAVVKLMSDVSRLETKLVEQQKEFELKQLRKEFEDFKKDQKNTNPYMDMAIAQLANVFSKGQNKVAISSPGIAGIDNNEPDQLTKAKAAITKLRKIDENFGDHLLLLSEFAEKKTDTYKAFIPTVKNML